MKILHRVNDCGINGSVLGSNAIDREFEYDPLNRLLSVTGRESGTQNQNDYLYADAPAPGTPNANNVQAYTRKYQYDKMGNVLQVKQQGSNGFTRKFGYITDVNTLEKISDNSDVLIEDFTYDECGNQLTAGVSRHYIWTAANRLLVYKNQTGSSDPTIFAQYDYDGAGNRTSKLVRTGTAGNPVYARTIYIDGIFEYHILENGTTYEKNYVHVMDDQSRIAMVRVGDTFPDDITESITYNLENQIKSSSARLDENGTVIDREEYYPFGDSSLRTFSKKRYRYVGKEKDLESGLYYYGARYYSAWTCRFISVDALAKKYNQLTPYQNAGNNPINDRDIDGNQGENSKKGGNTQEKNPNKVETKVQQPDNLSVNVQTRIETPNSSSEEASNTSPISSWSIPELQGSGDKSGIVGHGVKLTTPDAPSTDGSGIEGNPSHEVNVELIQILTGKAPGPKGPSSGFVSEMADAINSSSEAIQNAPLAQSELEQFVEYISNKVSSLYNAVKEGLGSSPDRSDIEPHSGEAPEVSFENNVNETASDSLEITFDRRIDRDYYWHNTKKSISTYSTEKAIGTSQDTIGGKYRGEDKTRILNVKPKD